MSRQGASRLKGRIRLLLCGTPRRAVPMSALRTCARQGRDILGAMTALLCHGAGHVLAFDHTASASGRGRGIARRILIELPTETR